MITSLTEMLELPNFGHMKTSTVCESRDKMLWRRHGQIL